MLIMDFPRAVLVFFLFSLFYLSLQLYLFSRLWNYLRSRVENLKTRRLLFCLATVFFLLMLYPLAWRVFSGLRIHDPFPLFLRGLVAFWVAGSTGSALVLLGYHLLRRIAGALSLSPTTPDPGRRVLLKMGLGVAVSAPFVISGYGVLLERRRFQVDGFDIPVDGLSSALSGFSIVHLTDIHAGPFMTEEELYEYVDAINRLEPDLVVLTGDFVSSSLSEVAPCVNAFSKLQAGRGVFACMGNHDVYARADRELTRRLVEKGIRVLRNDGVSIRVGNTKLSVMGVEDLRWGHPDLTRALKVVDEEPAEVRLLLSHRPEIFPAAARRGIDIVLSGHYHGGQIKLGPDPESLSIARLITPYAEGLFRLSRRANTGGAGAKDAVLFVSRGIGITGMPIRINCPPQIAHLTLRRA